MKLPAALFIKGDDARNRKVMRDMNHVTNIVWQSERETFQDCETITEQIIKFLAKEGYLT